MKRLHVHVAVHDLEQSIRFYSAMFAAPPAVKKDDYAKWMLDDPRVNFAISTRGKKAGLDHLGLAQADVSVLPQKDAACCYAKSDKYWTIDPQGIAWESFHTLDSIPMYGADTRSEQKPEQSACCTPSADEVVQRPVSLHR